MGYWRAGELVVVKVGEIVLSSEDDLRIEIEEMDESYREYGTVGLRE